MTLPFATNITTKQSVKRDFAQVYQRLLVGVVCLIPHQAGYSDELYEMGSAGKNEPNL